MSRSVSEWIGKHPDAKVPDRVRLRILEAAARKCYLTGIKIADGQPFDLEHVTPLSLGGEHRETNLRPALRLPHEVKSAAEAKIRAKADRQAKKAFGERNPNAPKIKSPGFKHAPRRFVEQLEMPARRGGIAAQFVEVTK